MRQCTMIWEYSEVFHPEIPEDTDGRAFALACCACMEEAAVKHARIMGLGVEVLHRERLAWVLARMHLDIPRSSVPKGGLRVKTWPVEVEKLQFRRDFLVMDAQDRVCVRGVTFWVVMDMETRRIKKMPEFIAGCTPPGLVPRAMEPEQARPEGAGEAPELASFTVRQEDTDSNRHVNNLRYIRWMLDCLPESGTSARLSALRVLFRAEAFEGDTVLVRGEPDQRKGAFRLGLFRRADGQELVRAVTLRD